MVRFAIVMGAAAGLLGACDADNCVESELSCDSSGRILQSCVDGEIVEEQDCQADGLECHADMGTPHCGPEGMGDGGAGAM